MPKTTDGRIEQFGAYWNPSPNTIEPGDTALCGVCGCAMDRDVPDDAVRVGHRHKYACPFLKDHEHQQQHAILVQSFNVPSPSMAAILVGDVDKVKTKNKDKWKKL